MRRHKSMALALFATLGTSLTAPVSAKTPDGKTPAEESVCDDVANNLFGLCNSYCEAIDCDSDEAHAEGCDSVYSNYLEKSGGEPPPCEAPTEPEIEVEDLSIEQIDGFLVSGVGS